ncbi:MAG: LysM peptidoglycan-binding domain-containing protein [Candidatus Promineifilaceae bacterium]
MKRSLHSRHLILFLVIILGLALSACERPLQEEINEEPESESAYPAKVETDGAPVESKREPFLPLVTELNGAEAYPSPFDGAASGSETAEEGEAAESPEPEGLVYEVQSGDTLGSIALQYDVSIEEIAQASGLLDANVLEVGQRLVIPIENYMQGDIASETSAEVIESASESSLESAPVTEQPAPVEPTYQIHVVQEGDNLYRIGLLYGCSHTELAAFNQLANPDYIDVGDEIRIPDNCEE